MAKQSGKLKRDVLGQMRNPLVFFALALLIIEAIIGTVVAMSQMTAGYQFASVCIMAVLFLAVVAAVTCHHHQMAATSLRGHH